MSRLGLRGSAENPLTFDLTRYDDFLYRMKHYALTNAELGHFAAHFPSGGKMAALGQCMMSLKLSVALLHTAVFFAAIMALLHLVAFAVGRLF